MSPQRLSPHVRLEELGIRLPAPPAPLASYVPAVSHAGLIHVSGQLPIVDGELVATGRVGGEVDPATAAVLARLCAINLLAAVDAAVGLDAVTRVVKLVGFVASDVDFLGQPAVVNGASDLMAQVFGEAGRHARSAVGVLVLPMGAPVEVEGVFAVGAP